VSQKHNVKKCIRETGSKYVSSATLVEKHFLWQTKNKKSHGLMAMIFLFVSTSRLGERSIQSPTHWVPDVLVRQNSQVVISHVHLVCLVKKSGSLTSNFPHMFNMWYSNTAS